VCWRAYVRAGVAPGEQAVSDGDRVSVNGDGVRADTANGDAASVKRKAKAGVTGGSQKRKKSSPVKIKDL
jgi:hypothetical protein